MPDNADGGEPPLDEQILRRVEDGVAWITLNRPQAQNALTPDQRDRLIELLSEASADVATRVVVLTATGKGFCTGADLRASRAAPSRPDDTPDRVAGDISRMLRDGAQRLIGSILDCEKPVIAGVNGTAAGIGAHMAFACDLVVAVRAPASSRSSCVAVSYPTVAGPICSRACSVPRRPRS